jgi:LytS/YehU family sensor histidine kinase
VALLCTFSSGIVEGRWFEFLIGYMVLAGCGLVITHAFRVWMIKRRWLDQSLAILIARVALAIPLMGAIYLGCAYLTAPIDSYLSGKTIALDFTRQHLELLLLDFVNSLFIFGSWASIYVGWHLIARCRREDREIRLLALALSQARLDLLSPREHSRSRFGALRSFCGLDRRTGPLVPDAIPHLATLLRYSFSTSAKVTVPFAAELNAVASYLELERLRFDDRLIIQKQIQPEVLDRQIPPMLLQTLVENAVKHSPIPHAGASEVYISAGIDSLDGRLCIQVRNSGHLKADGSSGIGLQNERERLHQLFGNEAQLSITEDPPGKVTAAVSVPNRQPTVVLPRSA